MKWRSRRDFEVEQVLKFNRPGVPAWWLNGRVLHRKTFALGQIRMLNFLTGIFRRIDPILPLPPLSLIAILRKGGWRHNRGGSSEAPITQRIRNCEETGRRPVETAHSLRKDTYRAFLCLSLPFSNPWVRGDGVGYYAFARSLLIEHRLDFTRDWLQANPSFQMNRVDANGRNRPGAVHRNRTP